MPPILLLTQADLSDDCYESDPTKLRLTDFKNSVALQEAGGSAYTGD